MPGTSKKINFHAAGHSQDLLAASSTIHKAILKGNDVAASELDQVIKLANELKVRLGHTAPAPAPVALDPFLTEAPKQADVAKLPTVQVPAIEKPKEVEKQKSGFLGR